MISECLRKQAPYFCQRCDNMFIGRRTDHLAEEHPAPACPKYPDYIPKDVKPWDCLENLLFMCRECSEECDTIVHCHFESYPEINYDCIEICEEELAGEALDSRVANYVINGRG